MFFVVYVVLVVLEEMNCISSSSASRQSLKSASLHSLAADPFREYLYGDQTYVNAEFAAFASHHGVAYEDDYERTKRLHTFRQNLRYIDAVNRQGLSYTLGVNHLADRTSDELHKLAARLPTTRETMTKVKHGESLTLARALTASAGENVPSAWDWRTLGAVSPVADQGACGSCWALAATGAIESAFFIKHGRLERFSAQSLIDCSSG